MLGYFLPSLRFTWAALCFTVTAPIFAQGVAPAVPSAEPEALAKLRAEYQFRARTSATTLNEYFTRYLSSLELIAASSGDYEQAQAVRLRLEGLAPVGGSSASAAGTEIATEIIPAVDKFTGGVTLEEASFTGWRSPTSAAEWTLRKIPPGKYAVEVTYAMTDLPALSITRGAPLVAVDFVIREASLIGAENKQTLPFATTVEGEKRSIRSVGTLDLSRPPVTLRLAPMLSTPGNRIVISSVKLIAVAVPSASAPQVTAAGATPVKPVWADELASLRTAHESRLASLRKPLVEAYTERLTALAASTSKTDEDTLDRLHDEKGRVARLLTGKSPPPKGKARPALLELDDYETLEGAHFVVDPANTGDRFKIEHNGQQLWLRLAWVAVASDPEAAPDKRHGHIAAERFGTSKTDTAELAKAARYFTELYLQGRDLRINTHGRKAPDGSLFGIVFIEQIGMFQNVLLDQGLAVVDAPPPKKDSNGLELELLKTLREHENNAMRQVPPIGGWIFRKANAPAKP